MQGSGSLSVLDAAEVARQDVLAAASHTMLSGIRAVVIQKHVQDLEDGPVVPYTGPGAHQYKHKYKYK